MNTSNVNNIKFDINSLIKVTDLIAFDGPILSHYINQRGENYLFYWVDTDDIINKWLFFRVDLKTLQDYISKRISLKELIINQSEGFVYSVDIDAEANHKNIQLILLENIDDSYLPSDDSLYEFEPIDSIDLASISQKLNTGVLEFRVTGNNVNYGSIPLTKFAPILPKIEDLRKSIAVKYIKTRKRSLTNSKNTDGKNNNAAHSNTKILKLDTEYTIQYALAGSFRIILNPVGSQTALGGQKTFADEFAKEMVSLFESGFDEDKIDSFAKRYDKNIIKKYNELIAYLYDGSMGFDIKWCNINTNQNFSQKILTSETKSILENLSRFSFQNSEELRSKGRFFAMNTKTGAYSFESTDEDLKSSGKLDILRKQSATSITFNKEYDVIIQRDTAEKVGGKEQTKDVLTSFIEVIED